MATWPAGPCGPVGGTQPASSSKGILAEKLQKQEGGAGAGRRVQLFHSKHCPPPTTLTESKQGLFGSQNSGSCCFFFPRWCLVYCKGIIKLWQRMQSNVYVWEFVPPAIFNHNIISPPKCACSLDSLFRSPLLLRPAWKFRQMFNNSGFFFESLTIKALQL